MTSKPSMQRKRRREEAMKRQNVSNGDVKALHAEEEEEETKDGEEPEANEIHQTEEGEEEEEEVLVVLELCDFKNHPIFDDHRSCRLEGIDTANPILHIGEYKLYGKLEETVGTNFFYDIKNRPDLSGKNAYQYVGQTTKKIKFTIAPPEE